MCALGILRDIGRSFHYSIRALTHIHPPLTPVFSIYACNMIFPLFPCLKKIYKVTKNNKQWTKEWAQQVLCPIQELDCE